MKLNQKGALDMMLVVALVVVLIVGGFVLMRISDTEDTDSPAGELSSQENNDSQNMTDDVVEEGNETEQSDASTTASNDYFTIEMPDGWTANEGVFNPSADEVTGVPEAYFTFDNEATGENISVRVNTLGFGDIADGSSEYSIVNNSPVVDISLGECDPNEEPIEAIGIQLCQDSNTRWILTSEDTVDENSFYITIGASVSESQEVLDELSEIVETILFL